MNSEDNLNVDFAKLDRKGFIDFEPDPTLDLVAEINKLKKEKNMIILAHYYQESDIQDVADYIGDSLGLAQQAEKPVLISQYLQEYILWQRQQRF